MSSGPYVEVKIKREDFEALVKCAEVSGRSLQSLIDECTGYFVEAYVPAYVEGVAERAATA